LINEGFKIVCKNIPVMYAMDIRQVRAAMAANIAGNDMQVIK
jgi:hypothetical protein